MTASAAGPAKDEPRKDVGSTLKDRRMLRGQSLETAHQHTRIPKKFLQALEDNAFDAFPAPVYLRGFLKGYCDFLDLEFEPLWAQLAPKPAPQEAEAAPKGKDEQPAPSAAPAPAPSEPSRPEPSSPAEPQPSAGISLALSESTLLPVLIFAALVVMAGLLWALKSRPRVRPSEQPAASSLQAPGLQPLMAATAPGATGQAAVSTSTAQAAPPAAAPAAPVAPAAPAPRAEQGTLRLTALRGSWIRLETDGRLVFEGQLPAGATQDFRARKEFRLRTADPRALSAALDGSTTDLLTIPAGSDGTRTIAR